ncbi:MAG TPA: NAD(P)/FAD-dependent oxidoreductase [Candidatus Sulfotelmatobacter sp.]|nr:NAD(P)/FAD-dependent oxidoreductase [Candidatus Sulfotelmatobacter sp.]
MREAAGESPVIIVGAGVAGLTAAIRLGEAGVKATVLEARDRMGGRVFTQHALGCEAPIELGAEFIHGKPPEIWDLLQQHGKKITEVDGENWCASAGRLHSCDFFAEVEKILEKMDDSSKDESFLTFLERTFSNPGCDARLEEAKRHALRYVSGFNAAEPGLVGVHWLVQGMRAEEKIEGDRAFRPRNGYEDLMEILAEKIRQLKIPVHMKTVVEEIRWRNAEVEVRTRNQEEPAVFSASSVLVTVPLGVLKAATAERGVIQFCPELPAEKLNALEKLEMGHVIRVVLRFRERFWEKVSPSGKKTLAEMSFLFSDDGSFPTWWTLMPHKYPVITGWAPVGAADRLSGRDPEFVKRQAVQTLARSFGVNAELIESSLESAHYHDWQSDPFSRGAYSYGKVGCDGAQQSLGAPVENTLFFAGEATDTSGRNGTVHGAIASGERAAKEILRARR